MIVLMFHLNFRAIGIKMTDEQVKAVLFMVVAASMATASFVCSFTDDKRLRAAWMIAGIVFGSVPWILNPVSLKNIILAAELFAIILLMSLSIAWMILKCRKLQTKPTSTRRRR